MYPWFAKALSAGQGDRLSVGPAGMNGCDLACCSNAVVVVVLVLVEANIFCNACVCGFWVCGHGGISVPSEELGRWRVFPVLYVGDT